MHELRWAFLAVIVLPVARCCFTKLGGMIAALPDMSVSFSSQSPAHGKKVICYLTDWSLRRQGGGRYSIDKIDPFLCTHILYAFAHLNASSSTIMLRSTDEFLANVTALKKYGVKVSVAVGGWSDSQGDKYSQMVNDEGKRAAFVASVVDFVSKYDFDGVDLDWEYPKCWQGRCEEGPVSDKQAFSRLVEDLRIALPTGSIISAAVSASTRIIPKAYDAISLSSNLDWIGIMAYNYHGHRNGHTGHPAPLYYHPEVSGERLDHNVDSSVKMWIELGADPTKLVLGIVSYGESYTLSNETLHGLGAPTTGPGNAGNYTKSRGMLAYYEICSKRWTAVVPDNDGRIGPYAYWEDQWVGYDDMPMVINKMTYVKVKGLGGVMVWTIDYDDFNNICGQGRYPLISAMKGGLFA